MTLARFVNKCVEMGAIRPPVDQLLQFRMVIFPDYAVAKRASDLLHKMDKSVCFLIHDNHTSAYLQFVNPEKL